MRNLYPYALPTLLACSPPAPGDTTDTAPTTTGESTSTTAAPDDPSSPATGSEPDATPGFIHHADADPNSSFECDLWAQDCPPGKKCAPWANDGFSWNAAKCVDITGDGAPDDPCTAPDGPLAGLDDCALGSFCAAVDAANHGVCAPLCFGNPNHPSCPPDFACSLEESGALNLCVHRCDPLLQDCPDDELCIHIGDAWTCGSDASGDGGQVNDPCEFINACDKGLICITTAEASSACDPGFQGCCEPICKLPDTPCPNPDQQCLPYFKPDREAPPGDADVGVCARPQ